MVGNAMEWKESLQRVTLKIVLQNRIVELNLESLGSELLLLLASLHGLEHLKSLKPGLEVRGRVQG